MTPLQKVQLSSEAYELIARKKHELQQAGILSYHLATSFNDMLAKLSALEIRLVTAEALPNKLRPLPGGDLTDSTHSGA